MNELIIMVLFLSVFVILYPAVYLFVRVFIEIKEDEIRFTLKKIKYIISVKKKIKNYNAGSIRILQNRQKQTKNI